MIPIFKYLSKVLETVADVIKLFLMHLSCLLQVLLELGPTSMNAIDMSASRPPDPNSRTSSHSDKENINADPRNHAGDPRNYPYMQAIPYGMSPHHGGGGGIPNGHPPQQFMPQYYPT